VELNAIELLEQVLFLSDFPEQTYEIFTLNIPGAEDNLPPFTAKIAFFKTTLKIKEMFIERALLKLALCDLALLNLFPENHSIGVHALPFQPVQIFLPDPQWEARVAKYRLNLKQISPNRQIRSDFDITAYEELRLYRSISIPPKLQYFNILQDMLGMNAMKAEWIFPKVNRDCIEIHLLECKCSVYKTGGKNKKRGAELFHVIDEQVEVAGGTQKAILREDVSKKVLERLERFGLIDEIDYGRYRQYKLAMRKSKKGGKAAKSQRTVVRLVTGAAVKDTVTDGIDYGENPNENFFVYFHEGQRKRSQPINPPASIHHSKQAKPQCYFTMKPQTTSYDYEAPCTRCYPRNCDCPSSSTPKTVDSQFASKLNSLYAPSTSDSAALAAQQAFLKNANFKPDYEEARMKHEAYLEFRAEQDRKHDDREKIEAEITKIESKAAEEIETDRMIIASSVPTWTALNNSSDPERAKLRNSAVYSIM